MRALVILAAALAVAAAAPKKGRLQYTPRFSGNGRIVGGSNAEAGQFPYQAMMRNGVTHNDPEGRQICGASVYNKDWIITAAHCCDGEHAHELGISVGRLHLNHNDNSEQQLPVQRIVMHHDYNAATVENDICLLHLKESIDLSGDNVGTIAIPARVDYTPGTSCRVSGWGTTSSGGSQPNNLKYVDVPFVTDDECQRDYANEVIAESMICAGEAGKDSCQGDSGGPMNCGALDSPELSGIVSWGYGCAAAGYPGVYTETSYFADWITGHADP